MLIDPVIMEPEVYLDPPYYRASEEMTKKRRNEWTGPDAMFERFHDRHPYRLWDQDVLRDYCEHGLLPDGEDGYVLACPPASEASVYGTSASVDPYPLIKKIKQPVKILRAPQLKQEGAFDFASSPTPPELAEKFSNGEDIFIDDLTHFMPMQDPERIAGLIVER